MNIGKRPHIKFLNLNLFATGGDSGRCLPLNLPHILKN